MYMLVVHKKGQVTFYFTLMLTNKLQENKVQLIEQSRISVAIKPRNPL